jgi:hypothetical protein
MEIAQWQLPDMHHPESPATPPPHMHINNFYEYYIVTQYADKGMTTFHVTTQHLTFLILNFSELCFAHL